MRVQQLQVLENAIRFETCFLLLFFRASLDAAIDWTRIFRSVDEARWKCAGLMRLTYHVSLPLTARG